MFKLNVVFKRLFIKLYKKPKAQFPIRLYERTVHKVYMHLLQSNISLDLLIRCDMIDIWSIIYDVDDATMMCFCSLNFLQDSIGVEVKYVKRWLKRPGKQSTL